MNITIVTNVQTSRAAIQRIIARQRVFIFRSTNKQYKR
jgi:hypothetical protein